MTRLPSDEACRRVLWCVLVLTSACRAPRSGEHVVVDRVAAGATADRAGLKRGDSITAWERGGTKGAVRQPWDLIRVEREQAPLGAVTLRGRRGPRAVAWTLRSDDWRLEARPGLSGDGGVRYAQTLERADRGEWKEAAADWQALAESVRAAQPATAAWILRRAGLAAAEGQHYREARGLYDAALAAAQAAGDPALQAAVLEAQAEALEKGHELAQAEEALAQAWQLRANSGWGRLAEAHSHVQLASLHFRERLDLARAQSEWQRALEVARSVSSDNLVVARTLNGLGSVAQSRGDPETAEGFYRRALALAEAREEEGWVVTASLANLGAILRARGDYASGERYLRRVLAVHERRNPDGEDAAHTLNSLGILAKDRGDFEQAEAFYKRALAIFERRSPGSLRVAGMLNNLGNTAQLRGDLAAAEDYHRRALSLRDALSPGSLDLAASLHNLGQIALARGRLDEAESLLGRARDRKQALAPDSAVLSNTLLTLGEVDVQRGDLGAARRLFERTLAIRLRLMPDSAAEAEAWRALGQLDRRAGRTAQATAAGRRAVRALELQRGRLGGDHDARVGFTAQSAPYFQDLLELLVGSGRNEEAFHALERSRARALLEMLAERDLAFAADLPPELARERRGLDRDYDRVQAELARLSPARDAAKVETQLERLRALRDARNALDLRVRAASPALASLQYPEPLDLARARAALDPGCLLVAFAVGRTETLVFVVRPRGAAGAALSVHRRPLGEDALRQRVAAFRGMIERGRESGALELALLAQSRRLYEDLLAPVTADLAAAQRLVLVPDGPLHALPFSALGPQPGRFLVEWKPIDVVLSATLYAELRHGRATRRRSGPLVAFGDPRYPAHADPAAGDGTPLQRAYRLQPLPGSREEVEQIARLYAPEAEVAVGADATEERVRQRGRQARYLHFAVHGLLDRRLPLDSALALTVPEHPADGQANGLLQAWELLEGVRVDAELVTLSACETGLGREMAGEGLIGLVRAFHYAGAPSVLASLWAVADRSTADLMVRFYEALRLGTPKDEALRQAQVALVRSGAHPFHWAAFQLHGDWQ